MMKYNINIKLSVHSNKRKFNRFKHFIIWKEKKEIDNR